MKMMPFVIGLFVATGSIIAKESIEIPEVSGQFVRIELPGENRALSLAEVRVFNKGVNLALSKPALQSTVAYSGGADRAVDGNADGDYMKGSVTHTAHTANPWWEVGLAREEAIEEIVVYNRTDSHGGRLEGFTLKILDGKRQVLLSQTKVPQSKVISFLQAGVKSSHCVASAAVNATVPANLLILSGQSNMVFFDPAVSFTPAVTKVFGSDSVIVVKDAQNSQSIRRWVKGWKSVQGKLDHRNGDLYDRLIERVKSAIEGREIKTVTFVWVQGEADAAENQVGVYKESLDTLLNQLRNDLGRDDINFVLGRLSDYSLDNDKHPQWQQMRDLQVAYADASPRGAWVNTDDLNNKVKRGKPWNDVHYTREGYKIFGERLAEKAIGLINMKVVPYGKKE